MARTSETHDHAGCCGHGLHPLALRLREAEDVCARRGTRLTAQRRQVLEVLSSAGCALGAYDLIEKIAAQDNKRVAPITIYRALDFLVAHDLVHRIESRNAFLACPSGHGPHRQTAFLICERCAKVCEAMSPALETALAALAMDKSFQPRGRVIELTGVCAACTTNSGE